MPVTPPRTIGVERFDPKYLTDEDLDDLVSFTGLDRDACLDRVQSAVASWVHPDACGRRLRRRGHRELADIHRWAVVKAHLSV